MKNRFCGKWCNARGMTGSATSGYTHQTGSPLLARRLPLQILLNECIGGTFTVEGESAATPTAAPGREVGWQRRRRGRRAPWRSCTWSGFLTPLGLLLRQQLWFPSTDASVKLRKPVFVS
jgi:hypothetical protein